MNRLELNQESCIESLFTQITEDKLKQGVNGLEWLVLQASPTEDDIYSLTRWMKVICKWKLDSETVMKDAITMNSDSFYTKYEVNWWIAVDETITYLHLLKKQSYDKYFNFIMDIERRLNQ